MRSITLAAAAYFALALPASATTFDASVTDTPDSNGFVETTIDITRFADYSGSTVTFVDGMGMPIDVTGYDRFLIDITQFGTEPGGFSNRRADVTVNVRNTSGNIVSSLFEEDVVLSSGSLAVGEGALLGLIDSSSIFSAVEIVFSPTVDLIGTFFVPTAVREPAIRFVFEADQSAVIPVPGALPLFASALALGAGYIRRRKAAAL
ncbi:MAG: hypothetical protein AAF862_05800 [Pseudomonadota bacterium]